MKLIIMLPIFLILISGCVHSIGEPDFNYSQHECLTVENLISDQLRYNGTVVSVCGIYDKQMEAIMIFGKLIPVLKDEDGNWIELLHKGRFNASLIEQGLWYSANGTADLNIKCLVEAKKVNDSGGEWVFLIDGPLPPSNSDVEYRCMVNSKVDYSPVLVLNHEKCVNRNCMQNLS